MKLIEVGDSLGVILPEEVLASLNVTVGDSLYVTELTSGGYNLSRSDGESGDDTDPTDQNKK
ncbi:AbrB/MazE/SpoVT family DNA-binding domain-containing protein [Hydrogenophaga defluvii]|uniref:AbrB/MazE/SpoVT family DNA-binding domain-containing protein n=1 Tax=Hydrogenophaga defluvii TaxID=249410 RepID=A0ABW2S9M9_9BURK